jgi:septum formation protein
MVNKVQQGQLILASKSLRRRYLLEQAGLKFEVVPSHFDEDQVVLTAPGEYARILAGKKAGEVGVQYPESWTIPIDKSGAYAIQRLGTFLVDVSKINVVGPELVG